MYWCNKLLALLPQEPLPALACLRTRSHHSLGRASAAEWYKHIVSSHFIRHCIVFICWHINQFHSKIIFAMFVIDF